MDFDLSVISGGLYSNSTNIARVGKSGLTANPTPRSSSLCRFSTIRSSVGQQFVGFCLLAESSASSRLTQGCLARPSGSFTPVTASDCSGHSDSSTFHQQLLEESSGRRRAIAKASRKWLLIEKRILVDPGIQVHIGHHASWQESGRYVAVCQISNQIVESRFASIEEKDSSMEIQGSTEGQGNGTQERSREEFSLIVRRIRGLLTYSHDYNQTGQKSNVTVIPIKLKSMFCRKFDLLIASNRVPRSSDHVNKGADSSNMAITDSDGNDENVVVPFGKSIQLLYTCKPFGSLPLRSWDHLAETSSTRVQCSDLQLFRIFEAVRSVAMDDESSKKLVGTSLGRESKFRVCVSVDGDRQKLFRTLSMK